MNTVLLPVKDFKDSKQRLVPALDATARARLAQAMLRDVLSVLTRARAPQRVVVFTAAEEVMELARPFGFDIVFEGSVDGHSAAVNQMVEELSATSSRILSIAADLPRLAPSEIDFAFNAASEPITFIPSRDWTGTNGVLFIPPARIAMEYGQGSFRRHLSKARAAGIRSDVMDLPGIAFDIDTPEDLQAFLADPRKDSETWRYLQQVQ
ncbi:MAG TPA: 2-phospho-L-lactate guanylyltransferase [Terriglobia bacterium]|jgi:2-phospho-L-lactate guanylyltransferase|nr:2-phospho-L-lactate guanylyltransferase [Terriglobia bacterium]